MFNSDNPVERYHRPLMTLEDETISEYVEAVREIAGRKLDQLPEGYGFQQSYDLMNQTIDSTESYAFERSFYREVMHDFDGVDTKTDLMRQADETVEAESLLTDYLRAIDLFRYRTESMRGLMLEEVFEEAKKEVGAQSK